MIERHIIEVPYNLETMTIMNSFKLLDFAKADVMGRFEAQFLNNMTDRWIWKIKDQAFQNIVVTFRQFNYLVKTYPNVNFCHFYELIWWDRGLTWKQGYDLNKFPAAVNARKITTNRFQWLRVRKWHPYQNL